MTEPASDTVLDRLLASLRARAAISTTRIPSR